MSNMNETLSLDHAAEYLKISKNAMYELADSGEVSGSKIGKSWVFRKVTLDKYLEEQERIQTEQRREAFREGKTAKIGTVVGAVRRKRVLPVLPDLPKAA